MNDHIGLYNKAVDLLNSNNFSEAENIFLFLVKKKPNHFNSLINLGAIFLKKKIFNKSLKYYLSASKIVENDIVYLGLGNCYYYLKNFKESQFFFLKALRKNKKNIQVILNLANFYFELKKFYLSKKYYFKFYLLDNKSYIFYRCLAKNNHELGLYSETLVFFKRALRENPNNLYLSFFYLNLFPKIHFSKETKNRLVKRYELILDNLIKNKNNFNINNNEIIEIFTSSTNFYLAYCKTSNKQINRKYFSLITFFLNKIYQYQEKNCNNLKKKIIIISSFFYNHTVSRLFLNFFKKLSLKYDLSILYLGKRVDSMTLNIQKLSNEFVHNTNLEFCINYLKNNNFDIVFFPEVGMSLQVQLLASMRFAKTQIVSWGHPITTGSNSIDYFISSELMEIENSQKFYNEILVELSDIGVDLDPKIFPVYNKLNNNLSRNKIINLQSLFKILPEDYIIYFKIIKNIPNVKFYFVQDSSDYINKKFFLNLKKYFNNFFKFTIIFEDYFYFVKRMKRKEFMKNIINYDLVLDTFGWSGGNTSIEAILSDLPVITLPSKEMRSRHTYAFLKHLDLDYLIANNEDDLLSKVKELITNDEIYWNLIEKIKKNKTKIFASNSYHSFQKFIETQ